MITCLKVTFGRPIFCFLSTLYSGNATSLRSLRNCSPSNRFNWSSGYVRTVLKNARSISSTLCSKWRKQMLYTPVRSQLRSWETSAAKTHCARERAHARTHARMHVVHEEKTALKCHSRSTKAYMKLLAMIQKRTISDCCMWLAEAKRNDISESNFAETKPRVVSRDQGWASVIKLVSPEAHLVVDCCSLM